MLDDGVTAGVAAAAAAAPAVVSSVQMQSML
jgi:cobalamin biosynthesis protein CbiD